MDREKILLVDDAFTLLKLGKAIFESGGYDVITADNGQQALQVLSTHSIDLIITDIFMPQMDGFSLCCNIRNNPIYNNTPIIVYTATYTSKSDEALAIEIGADMFIVKPASMPVLLGAAKELISACKTGTRKVLPRPESYKVLQKYNTRLAEKLQLKAEGLEEAQEILKIKEHRFQEFLEYVPEGITVLGINTMTFVQFNSNALRLLKYTADELVKLGPADISPAVQPDGRRSEEKAKDLVRRTIEGEKLVFEWTICDAHGKEIVTEVRLVTFTGLQGPQLLASFVDITERKDAELEREKMTNDIIHRNKELEQFAYIVSHNLRAPVANIIGIVDLLSRRSTDNNEEKMIRDGLLISVKKLDSVIKDLSYILQLQNVLSEKKEIVKFSHLLEDIRLSIADTINEKQVRFVSDFSEVDEINTIKSYLYSIFLNLISNSIKYRQPDLELVITIASSKTDNKIQLVFKDNGLGIDLERRGDQVFMLYKRFHSHVEGKGVGLFMVKTQVETLGGTISVSSQVNKGTEFMIEFHQ